MKNLTVCKTVLIALIAAGGCSSPPAEKVPEPVSPASAQPTAPEPADAVDALLARTAGADSAQRTELRLEAAGILIGRKDYARALLELKNIDVSSASSEQRARRAILLSEALSATGDPAGALHVLAVNSGPADAPLPRALEADIREARARALLVLGKALDAARERTALQPWLTDESDRAANSRLILTALGKAPLGEIEAALKEAGNDDWRGWLEVSLLARDMRRLPGAQRRHLQEWAQRHSGAAGFDTTISELLNGLTSGIAAPSRVALLLPLTGKAAPSGQAVLQGYLAEHYHALAAGETVPALAIVDTGGTAEGFAAAYRRTTGDGAEVVIGPLLKEELAAFRTGLTATVPTLALNFLDTADASLAGVRQFGIDLSDEVAELSSDARRNEMARAVVLADASPRSRRLVEEFSARWRNSGGELIDTLYLGDLNEYRLSLEQALHLDQSRDRSESLGTLLGLELQSEPRRRADVDLIVILAEPPGARSIRALLPFLYSGDIPARATSISYSAGSGREGDLDLETVRFLDMPWFSGSEDALRETASVQHGPVERLIALGIDANRLQSRLVLLDNAAAGSLGGATGELSTGSDGRLRRRATWYVIEGGQAKAELPRPEIVYANSTEGVPAWTGAEGTPPQPSGEELKNEP
jgi:outer membrane PBP1 activator LpoA protein